MPVSSEAPARLVFLGGVGEVGRNMACLELDERLLIIDVGLSFPSGDMPGIDLVLPDFDFLRSKADRIQAVVLTHGHEDHIGALPYLLRDIDRRLEVYGTPFTLALLQGKLEEHEVEHLVDLRTVSPGSWRRRARSRCGSFASPRSPMGWRSWSTRPSARSLHTGDFKIDQTPLDGRATDLHGLAQEAGRGKGVHLLLRLHERRGAWVLRQRAHRRAGPARHRRERRGLVVAACFSSHIHRVQQIVNAARANERVIVPRSLHAEVRRCRAATRSPPRRRQGCRRHLGDRPTGSRPCGGDAAPPRGPIRPSR